MLGDRLDCPYCGYSYSEEFMEDSIGKTFPCEECNKKIVVLLKRGFIRLAKRKDRMELYKRNILESENFSYMDNVIIGFIKQSAKNYNYNIKKDFFTKGKLSWVREARRNFFDWCISIDITIITIIKYFKRNNSNINRQTIKNIINEKD